MAEVLKNEVSLWGRVRCEPQASHVVYGETFYKFELETRRLSGLCDVLPVTVSDRLLKGVEVRPGCGLWVTGQLRSYNLIIDSVSRLVLTVFAKAIGGGEREGSPNEIALEGYLCKPCVYRVTPFGREITDMLVAVNRNYNKSDYIPCIVWGRNARFASGFKVGDRVHLQGRVQARDYEKVYEDGSSEIRRAYEVSVSRLEKRE